MTKPTQPAQSGSFMYPKSPAYDGRASDRGEQAAPSGASAGLLFPPPPAYDGAPTRAGDGIQRFALLSPAFAAVVSPTGASVSKAGRAFTFAVPLAPDGKAADMALDVSLSPVFPVDASQPADADGWGVLSVVFDPPSALVKPIRSGAPVTVTPRWHTSDGRTIDEGRAQLVFTVRAARVQGA